MKKLISTTLVLTMILSMCACGAKKENTSSETASSEVMVTEDASSEAANSDRESNEAVSGEESDNTDASSEEATDKKNDVNIGVLSMLNISEEETMDYITAQHIALVQLGEEGFFESLYELEKGPNPNMNVVFYDTLDSMLMALNAGDIDGMMVYNSVAQYLCATNDNLQCRYKYNFDDVTGRFAQTVLSGHLRNDFAFLMMEGNESLRDEFSNAISDMKDDGTMDKLISEQIDGLINGGDVKAVQMPKIEGAETVKVAVTGALPPMDYVAADGNPAGFNTAVLAEISQRIGKNIEIVVVDSIGRASALSSGTVDAVFWTRTNNLSSKLQEMSDEEVEADLEKRLDDFTEEELAASTAIRELISIPEYGSIDMPEGTICTESYYSDIFMPVNKKQ